MLEASLAGRDQVLLRFFSRCGLRAGEVFGPQWGDILPEQAILISRTFSKGKIGPPKTKGSAKAVAIPKSLFQDLMCLREEQGKWKPEDWVFPASRVRGEMRRPLSAENWLKRTIKPLAEQLGFTINLHMFRRGFATIAHQSGGSLKDIQEQLRHASVTTTANIYVQAVPENVRAVVEKIDHTSRNTAMETVK
ncbi:MAG TPA: site-specific integrase [Bryobacteraceae bacterium]|nr:site-specific integrase [Bryobacteraceae bacterium]